LTLRWKNLREVRMKKLIGFDLDGTLTQHKSPLEPEVRELLTKLSQRCHLLMVGAGVCERIYRQMGEFPIEIIGSYGMQHSVIRDGKFTLIEDIRIPCDREKIDAIVTMLRKEFGLENFTGNNVEFHASGAITFPLLGTQARLEDKLSCDPDRSKRRKLYPRVCEAFAGYNVFIGGSSSFDITPPGYDKFHALMRYCAANGLNKEDVLYVGDDFGDGGNDSQIRLGGMDYIEIDDYRNTPEKLRGLL